MQKYLAILLSGLCLAPIPAFAFYSNDTFELDAEHTAPASFGSDGANGFYGTTEDGRAFTQKPVANDLGIKLHKFAIDEAFFYISDKGAFTANSDLAAISIYLSM